MTSEIKTPAPAPDGSGATGATAMSRPAPAPPPSLPQPLTSPPRELRTTLTAVGAGLLAALTWSFWQSTGSRLALFVCAATVVAAVVDITWAIVATRRIEAVVTANPAEALVGDTLVIGVSIAGPRQFVEVGDPELLTALRGVEVPDEAGITGVASHRDVLASIVIELRGRGVAGFVTCIRRPTLPLRRPLSIGPRPVPAAEQFPELYRTWGEGQARPAPTGDLVRGVRPYVAGDPMRKVHWRATARDLAGDLVVKDVEETGAPRLYIALDLGNGGPAGERAAGRAAWYAEEGLRRGYEVILATVELSRRAGTGPPTEAYRAAAHPVTGPVRSSSDVIRRLAAARAPGKPAIPRPGEPGGIVVVTDQGDSWR